MLDFRLISLDRITYNVNMLGTSRYQVAPGLGLRENAKNESLIGRSTLAKGAVGYLKNHWTKYLAIQYALGSVYLGP